MKTDQSCFCWGWSYLHGTRSNCILALAGSSRCTQVTCFQSRGLFESRDACNLCHVVGAVTTENRNAASRGRHHITALRYSSRVRVFIQFKSICHSFLVIITNRFCCQFPLVSRNLIFHILLFRHGSSCFSRPDPPVFHRVYTQLISKTQKAPVLLQRPHCHGDIAEY